jgi:ribosomal protein S18 acetylase RimI-like enzyme
MKIEYKVKTATQSQIHEHLRACKDSFNPPLDARVVLSEYAEKLFEKSVTFEAWDSGTLVGLVSAYLNDSEKHAGFISHVSTSGEYRRRGIASTLVGLCIEYSGKHGYRKIDLEVARANTPAIQLYEYHGFRVHRELGDIILMRYMPPQ